MSSPRLVKNHHKDAEDLNPEWEVQSPATMENKVKEGTIHSSDMWQSVKGEKALAEESVSNAQVETQRRLR